MRYSNHCLAHASWDRVCHLFPLILQIDSSLIVFYMDSQRNSWIYNVRTDTWTQDDTRLDTDRLDYLLWQTNLITPS